MERGAAALRDANEKFVSVHDDIADFMDVPPQVMNDTRDGPPSLVAARVVAGISCVALVLGLAGNLLVIAAVLRNRSLRTRGNSFIVSLSIVGILFVALVLGPGIDTLIHLRWRGGDVMCAFHTYYTLAFSLLSLLHTMCIGLDRLVNVVLFTRAKRIASSRNIGLAIALCWIVTALIVLCYHFLIVKGDMLYLEKALRCIEIFTPQTWKLCLITYCLMFILPSVVVVASYITILVFVRRKRKTLISSMSSRVGKTSSRVVATCVTNTDILSIGIVQASRSGHVGGESGTVQRATKPVLDTVEESTEIGRKEPERGPSEEGRADGTPSAKVTVKKTVEFAKHEVSEDTQSPNHRVTGTSDDQTGNGHPTTPTTPAGRDGLSSSREYPSKGDEPRKVITESNVNSDRSSGTGLDGEGEKGIPVPHRSIRRRASTWHIHGPALGLRQMARNLRRSRERIRPSRIRNDRDLNRMMLAIFTVVWIGYIPYHLVRFIDIPTLGIDVGSSVYLAVTLTMYVGGCVNPIIYGLMHRRFKAAFVEMLTFGRCKSTNRVGAEGRDRSMSGTENSTALPPTDASVKHE